MLKNFPFVPPLTQRACAYAEKSFKLTYGMEFLAMPSSTPTAHRYATSELPPALINGNGNPVGGIAPHTPAILSMACTLVTAVMPSAR